MEWRHLVETLEEFGQDILDRYKNNLDRDHNAGGDLGRTMYFDVRSGNNFYSITLHLEEYWKWLENGRGPTRTTQAGNPTLREIIQRWIVVKHIIPRQMTLSDGRTVIPTIPQLAYLISRKIHQEGYKGRHYLENAVKDARYEFEGLIKDAIRQDMDEAFEDWQSL